ncbi:hypothetical protein C0991_006909, partial [Blastosporella zonata]
MRCPSTPPPRRPTPTPLRPVYDTTSPLTNGPLWNLDPALRDQMAGSYPTVADPPAPLTTPNAASTTLLPTEDPLSNIDPALRGSTARSPSIPLTPPALATAGTDPIAGSPTPPRPPSSSETPSPFLFDPITSPAGTTGQFIFPDDLFHPASPATSSALEHHLPS